MGLLEKLFVLPDILLRECLGKAEEDAEEDEEADHEGDEAGNVVAILQMRGESEEHFTQNGISSRQLWEVLLRSGEISADRGAQHTTLSARKEPYVDIPPTVWKSAKPVVCV